MNRQDKFSQNSANKVKLVQIMCCIIMFSVTLQPSSAEDITTTCPSSYVEAVASQVNCTVNLTAFTACSNALSLTELTFSFMQNGSNVEQFWCATSIQSCSSTKRNDDTCNNCSCSCLDDSTSSAAKYQLIFTPEQQNHAGGTFSCDIACFPPGLTSSSDVNCAPIGPIMPQPTTQPPTETSTDTTLTQQSGPTDTPTLTPDTSTTTTERPNDNSLIAAIVGSSIAGLAVLIAIIVIICLRCRHNKKKSSTTSSATVNQPSASYHAHSKKT